MTSWTAPKTYTAGSALTASELNTHTRDNLLHLYERVVGYSPTMASDSPARNSATFADLTGLSFPVANGKNYTWIFIATWEHSSTSGGPVFGFTHAGGNCVGLFEYTGESSTSSDTRDWEQAQDTGSGVATVDTSGVRRICVAHGRHQATASGTFQMRYARNTTGSVIVHAGSSLFVTSD